MTVERGTHVPQLGTVRALYSYRIHFGGFTVHKRMVGPYLVATSVDFMGRATSTIWIKEDE